MPGQIYNPDEQCRLIWGSSSYLCRVSDWSQHARCWYLSQMHLLHTKADVSSKTSGLQFALSLHRHPLFVYMSSEVSDLRCSPMCKYCNLAHIPTLLDSPSVDPDGGQVARTTPPSENSQLL